MLIDVIFALLILFACITGMRKGFIVGLFSIIAVIIGIAAALKLSAVVATKLSSNVNISGKWLPLLSFIMVFLIVVFLVNLGGRLIQKTFEAVMLGWLNRLAGALLFIVLYAIVYSIFLFYAVQMHFIKDGTINASQIYPYIQPLGFKIINSIGSVIPVFKDIFGQLENFFHDVSNKMQH